jgi:hypothetical protein
VGDFQSSSQSVKEAPFSRLPGSSRARIVGQEALLGGSNEMQTFLPYRDFVDSAKCLDYRRLGKQRSECKILLRTLFSGKGWIHHPATKMWAGFEMALCEYYNAIVKEWVNRGYRNNMPLIYLNHCEIVYPSWLGDERFHSSHRSNLLRKDPEYYGKFCWAEPKTLPYFWPA